MLSLSFEARQNSPISNSKNQRLKKKKKEFQGLIDVLDYTIGVCVARNRQINLIVSFVI